MKKTITLILTLITIYAFAQDPMFVHTAEASNTIANVTYIDHPDLNGNPSAKVVITHNYNPPGSPGVYNDNVTGVWYDSFEARWSIFNENLSNLVLGSSYNVFIAKANETISHVSTAANQGTSPAYTVLNHSLLNGNPNAKAVITNYWNPNSVYNNHNYGFWYDDIEGRWIIFAEDLGAIPLDSAFFVAVEGSVVQTATHVAQPANITGNYTLINNPLLNGNPNAVFVIAHNWGLDGDPSNVIVDHTLGVWYDGANWGIYTEDLSAMPVNATFDLLIYDETLGSEDNSIDGLTYAPNPTRDFVNISANEPITEVRITNILGQEVELIKGSAGSTRIDLSAYATGNYFATVQTETASETIKLIKQ